MAISPKVVTVTKTTVVKQHSAQITGEQLVSLINTQRRQLGQRAIPGGATVYFTVPSGGDYSGMSMDVDSENPVTVEWSEQSEFDERSEDSGKKLPLPPAPPTVPVDSSDGVESRIGAK